ncbi:MAG: hypothetical protein PHY32_04615 [Candidatus Pacebacteria bacterium]|nr:hypothetical protein [Candidatus Paceibacterota bacterium]
MSNLFTNIEEAITFNATPKTQVNLPTTDYNVLNTFNNTNWFTTNNSQTDLQVSGSNYSAYITHYSFDPVRGTCIKDEDGPYTSMTSCTKYNQSLNFISDNTFNFNDFEVQTSNAKTNDSSNVNTTDDYKYNTDSSG